jgi:transglutaminase-like putative cysteine protease
MATNVARKFMAWGDTGTAEDLSYMAALIDRGLDVPMVVSAARRIAVDAGILRPAAQARAIRAWLARVWRFVDDPARRELLRDAEHMLREYDELGVIMGDCDEAAVLGATLGNAVGIQAQLTALAFPDSARPGRDRWEHVFAVLLTPDDGAVNLDVTPRPAGPTPQPTRTMTLDL